MRLVNKYYIGEEVWYSQGGRPKKSSVLSIHATDGVVFYSLMDATSMGEYALYPTESACQAALYKDNLKTTAESLKVLQEQCVDLLGKIKKFLKEEV